MKFRPAATFVTVCWALLLPKTFFADSSSPQTEDDATEAVRTEIQLVAEAQVAAKNDDDLLADSRLIAAGKGGWAAKPSGSLLARRAVAVCGNLRNENEGARAVKVAARVVQQLANMREASPSDRAERLFWEAWLEAEMLGHRSRAIALLQAAEKLAPEDERITDMELRLVSAATPWSGGPVD